MLPIPFAIQLLFKSHQRTSNIHDCIFKMLSNIYPETYAVTWCVYGRLFSLGYAMPAITSQQDQRSLVCFQYIVYWIIYLTYISKTLANAMVKKIQQRQHVDAVDFSNFQVVTTPEVQLMYRV
ncbi:uncharacterized protein BYT42DRAFT_572927 [Radiomyces spectabilis]|uniref:uncharacterized protein n=1 Tax=Radiomyces spectabilis TaxID=64574 RepID=UPI00221E59C8|nr:uncharacterized protein BYT42DRAFT_572927 [Radiomyces spectabilis]KAI8375965.1 hypothetical protein BYT42DRAFT_572927 [Radiomyces spectabilis]